MYVKIIVVVLLFFNSLFREQNFRLVPLLLKRLRRLQSSTDFLQPKLEKTDSSPSYSESTTISRPFAHLNNASPPYRNSEQGFSSHKSNKYHFLIRVAYIKVLLFCTILEKENGIITPIKRTASMMSPDRADPGEPYTPSKEDSSVVSKQFYFFCINSVKSI